MFIETLIRIETYRNNGPFKETLKNALKKLEFPMEAVMTCKLKTFRHREICGESNDIRKSKDACIVEAHESTRKRLESTPPKDHEDHIASRWKSQMQEQWTKNGRSSNSWPRDN